MYRFFILDLGWLLNAAAGQWGQLYLLFDAVFPQRVQGSEKLPHHHADCEHAARSDLYPAAFFSDGAGQFQEVYLTSHLAVDLAAELILKIVLIDSGAEKLGQEIIAQIFMFGKLSPEHYWQSAVVCQRGIFIQGKRVDIK